MTLFNEFIAPIVGHCREIMKIPRMNDTNTSFGPRICGFKVLSDANAVGIRRSQRTFHSDPGITRIVRRGRGCSIWTGSAFYEILKNAENVWMCGLIQNERSCPFQTTASCPVARWTAGILLNTNSFTPKSSWAAARWTAPSLESRARWTWRGPKGSKRPNSTTLPSTTSTTSTTPHFSSSTGRGIPRRLDPAPPPPFRSLPLPRHKVPAPNTREHAKTNNAANRTTNLRRNQSQRTMTIDITAAGSPVPRHCAPSVTRNRICSNPMTRDREGR